MRLGEEDKLFCRGKEYTKFITGEELLHLYKVFIILLHVVLFSPLWNPVYM